MRIVGIAHLREASIRCLLVADVRDHEGADPSLWEAQAVVLVVLEVAIEPWVATRPVLGGGGRSEWMGHDGRTRGPGGGRSRSGHQEQAEHRSRYQGLR